MKSDTKEWNLNKKSSFEVTTHPTLVNLEMSISLQRVFGLVEETGAHRFTGSLTRLELSQLDHKYP